LEALLFRFSINCRGEEKAILKRVVADLFSEAILICLKGVMMLSVQGCFKWESHRFARGIFSTDGLTSEPLLLPWELSMLGYKTVA